ncbi:MAG: ComEC/Rec2 family competence protein, partial [Ginsengibacter sp.]
MSPIWFPIWKKAPFLRLLLPLIAGILLQWYFQYEWIQIIFAGCGFTLAFILFQLLPLSLRFKLQVLQGVILNLILIVVGLILTYQKDIRHQQDWFGNLYHDSGYLAVTINEPLLEKTKSYKAESIVNSVIENDSAKSCKGKLLLYFEKDTAVSNLKYGDKILISKKLQLIKNSGNPGAFNYQRYSAFQQIFHQIYLKKSDWILLGEKNVNAFNQFMYTTRDYILKILQKNIKGEHELGIAEALLIGYKADLDTDLVQAYSNTGVVHIIAISGLHLGLIYFMLLWIFNQIPFLKRSKILKAIFILLSLWLFALLTGASASVLRSAVMFSCIVAGESFGKKSSIYNSLAASAFLLLCYNPYFLWDVGFQLSYLAVVGIVIFQKHIYNWIYIKNKWIDKVWKLLAISLAAQVFTFPVCLYYFHQFPNLFLLSNLIAVPLSSLILFAEIFLVAFATSFKQQDELVIHFIGFEKEQGNSPSPCYHRILCDSINDAICGRYNKLWLGRTALEAKAMMGAKPVKVNT